MSSVTSPTRSRVKRAALVLSAVLFATTLAIGGGLAANAAPSILSAPTATANSKVTVTVTGFTPNESLTFNFDSTPISTDSADGTGAFTGPLYIPDGATVGTHIINVVGGPSPTQSASIDIVAQPTASPAAPTVTASVFGTTGVTITFSGFTAGDTVQLGGGTPGGFGGEIGTPVTVDGSGSVSYTARPSDFSSTVAVPGVYVIGGTNAAGNINSQAATITVVADPAAPATPVKTTARFAG
jgi:hypothetical protein